MKSLSLYSKKFFFISVLLFASITSLSAQTNNKARGKWSEEAAWQWEKKVGVIKGFNAPVEAYPGMSRDEIFKKAHSLGYNSVRIWMPSNANKCVDELHKLLNIASKYKLTISPVLQLQNSFVNKDQKIAESEVRKYLTMVLGEFRNDSRIVFWDLVNEPAINYFFKGEKWTKEALFELEWCKKSILIAREISPSQPITISALYLTEHIYKKNEVFTQFKEVAAMTDIHNFHLYDLSLNRMQAMDDMVKMLKDLGNRPIVCTEAVARTRGGTFARSLTAFSKYHIHFYNWGLYTSDANWDTAWDLSSFEPYEPWFHDVLHPDGTPYDYRDIDWIRNFHFADKNEVSDPGAEITERWNKWRAWKWMANGPIKGLNIKNNTTISDIEKTINEASIAGYNSIRVKWEYVDWKKDSTAFYKRSDTLLFYANKYNISVMPVLLTDLDANNLVNDLTDYVSKVVKKYGFDIRIQAWELYFHPGESGIDRQKLTSLLGSVFRVARFEFPNQPLTATPLMKVRNFEPGFDYKKHLVHGQWAGWDRIEFVGSGNPELCNYIWSLSDIISIDSEMKAAETGWLLNIANRYGRPVVCSGWNYPNESTVSEMLDIFAKNKVYWYNNGIKLNSEMINSFRFKKISTPLR